jgi:hypothetical protein
MLGVWLDEINVPLPDYRALGLGLSGSALCPQDFKIYPTFGPELSVRIQSAVSLGGRLRMLQAATKWSSND